MEEAFSLFEIVKEVLFNMFLIFSCLSSCLLGVFELFKGVFVLILGIFDGNFKSFTGVPLKCLKISSFATKLSSSTPISAPT